MSDEPPQSRPARDALRIAIYAGLDGKGHAGGIEQFVMSLVHGLGKLSDGNEEYIIVTRLLAAHWLDEYVGANQTVVPLESWPERLKCMLGPARPIVARAAYRLLSRTPGAKTGWISLPQSTGFFERLGANVVHFPYQSMLATSLPCIYNPHDLQHRHFPEFFTRDQLKLRESHFQSACQAATCVAVASDWIRRDIVAQLGIAHAKVQVIPDAVPTEVYDCGKPSGRPSNLDWLPDGFALYPAQTWPHKNHLRLLDALALNRDRFGVTTPLVCTGRQNEHWPAIRTRIERHNLKQVYFLGYVEPGVLRALYARALFVVMPSLHESVSYPVSEAFASGVPVACSTVTSLPEQCAGAASLFDPYEVEDIARALRSLALDAGLRQKLSRAGKERAAAFSVQRTARAYRALYKKVAGRPLSGEDQDLLDNNWMAA